MNSHDWQQVKKQQKLKFLIDLKVLKFDLKTKISYAIKQLLPPIPLNISLYYTLKSSLAQSYSPIVYHEASDCKGIPLLWQHLC